MSSSVRDNDAPTAAPETAAHSAGIPAPAGGAANKHQPVALEVAVTVNGARTVEGSDKREPFSESTMTVLVFSNGAVVRLASAVTPGQLLFLSNEKTKREVVCQVVKSKSYRSVSGYVELEFTEPVVGFWGMRFPGERTTPLPSAPAPASLSSPTHAPAAAPPVPLAIPPSKTEIPVVQKPSGSVPPVAFVPVKPVAPTPSVFDLPPVPIVASPKPVPPPAAGIEPTTVSRGFESKPAMPPAKTPPAPVTNVPESEALKLEAARLQDQLSHLLFTDTPAAKPAHSLPGTTAVDKKPTADSSSKVFEIPKTQPPPLVVPSQPPKSVPIPPKPLQPAEMATIPAWLEPLPRSVVVPSPGPESVVNVEAQHLLERAEPADRAVEYSVAAEVHNPAELPAPSFGNIHEESSYLDEATSGGGNRGILVGAIAAGVLLLTGGGFWYFRHQSSGVHAAVAASAPQLPAIPENSLPSSPQTNLPSQTNSPQTIPSPSAAAVPTAAVSSTAGNNPLGTVVPANEKTLVPAVRSTQPAQGSSKKSALGEVRLAAPTMNRRSRTQDPNESDLGLALDGAPSELNQGALGAGLGANSNQPAAPVVPLPVGGDVRPAKLLTTIPPTYPSLARSQHISGDVRVDALIDAAGHVTTMKVVSGPTLLHQAAMDALRQWKYQPASLDGKAVPMHLTVTIQFRLQ
jgi:TonB family protein